MIVSPSIEIEDYQLLILNKKQQEKEMKLVYLW